MSVDVNAGKLPEVTELTDLPRLVSAYYTLHPDPANPAERVSFGTSGHRGSSLQSAFNEDHILAITQAIVEYRAGKGISGPLFLAMDTHALSAPAFRTALEVLAAQGVEPRIDNGSGPGDPQLQRRPQGWPGRWHRDHAFAQPP